jgi:Protein of unknown function (DUF3426)
MTLRCPRCGTLYRRPARAKVEAGTTFRCARCRHVFRTDAEAPEVAAAPPPPPPPPLPDPEPDVDEDEDAFVFGDDEEPAVDEALAADADDDADEPDERDARARPRRRRPAAPAPAEAGVTPARFALRSLLGVSLLYALVSIYLYTNPDAARDALARIPILGGTLAEARVSPASIQLANVRGEYLRVKGDQLVFAVHGTAVNHAPMRVKSVLIEATLHGVREERQVVFCGAAPRDIRDLSVREIALLQTLEPPKDWGIAPGDQADFLVAFTAPPKDLREFSAEVLAVQAPPHRTTGTVASASTPRG